MNEKNKKNKELIDENGVDWSGFGELWGKLYFSHINQPLPPELDKARTSEAIKAYFHKKLGAKHGS